MYATRLDRFIPCTHIILLGLIFYTKIFHDFLNKICISACLRIEMWKYALSMFRLDLR